MGLVSPIVLATAPGLLYTTPQALRHAFIFFALEGTMSTAHDMRSSIDGERST